MKAFIAILVVLVLGILSFGGYYLYEALTSPEVVVEPASQAQQQQTGPQFGATQVPENEYDVLDALYNAYEANDDTVAWIEVPGTTINDSVLQSNDNYYYLRRAEDEQYDVYGCYFMDYECDVSSREAYMPNTIIYGHSNTANDSNPNEPRFSQLFHFLDRDFALKTPYIKLYTLDETSYWEVFAAGYTTTEFDYIQVQIDGAQMLEIANRGKALSVIPYNVELDENSHILTLSTCSYKYTQDGSGRFIVMAKLVENGAELRTEANLA